MEALSETQWDVTIAGTGLAQSLLALALSRSGKKVLHVDKNPYYGGAEAAFSLEEAEQWADHVNKDPNLGPFQDAVVKAHPASREDGGRLGRSRSYTLSLSPHVIYTRSDLIPTLVSSKVYKQLEFHAVGSWWIYRPSSTQEEATSTSDKVSASLHRVPSSREDIFADKSISLKGKRALIKFLRTILQPVNEEEEKDTPSAGEVPDGSFRDYLKSSFQIPDELQDPLVSLSLSQNSPQNTSAKYAVARIKRHLSSIGAFGPGFGALLTKWGGSSEIAQVGCRALAVGGGVYVLDRGIQSIQEHTGNDLEQKTLEVKLTDDQPIHSKFVVGSTWDLPSEFSFEGLKTSKVARAIFIVASPLSDLFPPTAEGGPIPAGCVVVVPGDKLTEAHGNNTPVHLLIHSSETGECPDGQCVIYGNVSVPGAAGEKLITEAVEKLLHAFETTESHPAAAILWSLHYTQVGVLRQDIAEDPVVPETKGAVICLRPPSLDLAFDDSLIDEIRAIWKKIVGDEEAREQDFMAFEDRPGTGLNDGDDGDDGEEEEA